MNDDDLYEWCDDHLPELYNNGMFDHEEISDDVWDAVKEVMDETIFKHMDDDEDVGDLEERLLDIAETWFRNTHAMGLESIEPLDTTAIQEIMDRPQVAQHSGNWYAERSKRLTASEFSQILDGRRGALLRQKIGGLADEYVGGTTVVAISQEDGEMIATDWGHRFEPITRAIYEQEVAGVDTVCDTLGRFTHRTYPWLSASPDGLVMRGELIGRLVEIKAPKTRQPGTYVPVDYYAQMQVQMEVCDLEAVDFIEAQYSQIRSRVQSSEDGSFVDQPIPADVADARWKGLIRVYGYLECPETWVYRYSDPVEDFEDAVVPDGPPGLPILEESVWWLRAWYPRTILRNRDWWSTVGWPNAEAFWVEVESMRSSGVLTVPDPDTNDDVISHVGCVSSSGWLGSTKL